MNDKENFEQSKAALLEEYYDLQSEDVILQKELYAHFGLLFFKFSLVEHSLINVLLFHNVGKSFHKGEIKSKVQWENSFDAEYEKACNLTLGNLIKRVLKIPEFSGFEAKLNELKQARDYFAHRFFRDEVGLYGNDEGIWILLAEIARFRNMTMSVEKLLMPSFEKLCDRLGIPIPNDIQSEVLIRELKEETLSSIRNDTVKFGWDERIDKIR